MIAPGLPQIIRVVDLETTGFDEREHCIIEIGWQDLIAQRTDIGGAPLFTTLGDGGAFLVKPTRPIPPESSAIHQLADEDFGQDSGAVDWDVALAAVTRGAPVRAFAAHSAQMERKWLTPEAVGDVPWICTHKCALRTWPDAPSHSNQALRWWLKPRDLERARALPPHRAGPDAYATAFILRALLAEHPIEQLIQWTTEPALLTRVSFGEHRGKKWSEVDVGLLHWVLSKDFDEDTVHTVKVEIARRRKAAEEEAVEAEASPRVTIEKVGG